MRLKSTIAVWLAFAAPVSVSAAAYVLFLTGGAVYGILPLLHDERITKSNYQGGKP